MSMLNLAFFLMPIKGLKKGISVASAIGSFASCVKASRQRRKM
jgi:hypothetical protein